MSIIIVLAVSLFLLLFVGFGVDMTNLFFHRQTAQNTADAACVAAGMDMLRNATSGTSLGGFTRGKAYACTSSSTDAPCKYAALNGYNSPGLSAGEESNQVSISFPPSVPGVNADTTIVGANPFVEVDVVDRVHTYFTSWLSGSQTQDVRAFARCGLQNSTVPISILVLDPRNESSVFVNGTPAINIYGGPSRGIQVNSSSSSAVVVKGAASAINLCQGGPAATGSDFGVTGAQPSVSDLHTGSTANCLLGGATGSYLAPDSPISDPFASVCAPGQSTFCMATMDGTSVPGAAQGTSWPASGDGATVVGPNDGCPLGLVCNHYQSGVYNNGINVKLFAAVFEPGLYYVKGGMSLGPNTQVCPGTGAGDGSGGTTFYFADGNTISVAANAGKLGLACSSSTKLPLTANDIKCTGSSALPGNLPGATVLFDNILVAPCGGYYGDPLGTNDPVGEQRGILFFQNRDFGGVQASWGGGGAFTLAGSMYFHYCASNDVAGAGTDCNFTSGYTDNLTLQGSACAGTYILGNIITDQLSLGGTPCINMDLSPVAQYHVLKVALLQ